MGILKYYSPYVNSSIKIKIQLKEKGALLTQEIKDRMLKILKIEKYNLDIINRKKIESKERDMPFDKMESDYDPGTYYLTLFYKCLLKDMSNLFEGCSSFTEIDLSKSNIYKVEKMSKTFKDCSNVTEIIFAKSYNINKMESTFEGCNKLKKINLLNVKLKSQKNNYQEMFSGLNRQLKDLLSEKKHEFIDENKILVYTKDETIKQIIKDKNLFTGNTNRDNMNSQASNEGMPSNTANANNNPTEELLILTENQNQNNQVPTNE